MSVWPVAVMRALPLALKASAACWIVISACCERFRAIPVEEHHERGRRHRSRFGGGGGAIGLAELVADAQQGHDVVVEVGSGIGRAIVAAFKADPQCRRGIEARGRYSLVWNIVRHMFQPWLVAPTKPMPAPAPTYGLIVAPVKKSKSTLAITETWSILPRTLRDGSVAYPITWAPFARSSDLCGSGVTSAGARGRPRPSDQTVIARPFDVATPDGCYGGKPHTRTSGETTKVSLAGAKVLLA